MSCTLPTMFARHLRPPDHSFFFVWTGPERTVGIEVKAGAGWRHEAGRGLRELLQRNVVARAVGVFTGERALRDGDVVIYPVRQFLRRLPEIIG
jgi:hypothetical protein